MQDKIVLFVRVRTKPGKKEPFLKQLNQVVKTMSAEINFLNAIVHNNVEKPNEVVIYETWKGTRESWMRDEFPRAYRKPYEAVLSELIDERSIDWLIPVE